MEGTKGGQTLILDYKSKIAKKGENWRGKAEREDLELTLKQRQGL